MREAEGLSQPATSEHTPRSEVVAPTLSLFHTSARFRRWADREKQYLFVYVFFILSWSADSKGTSAHQTKSSALFHVCGCDTRTHRHTHSHT